MGLDAMGRWVATQQIMYVESGQYTLDTALNNLRRQGYFYVALAVAAHFDAQDN